MIREGPLNIFTVKKSCLDNQCLRNSDNNYKRPIYLLSASSLLESAMGTEILFNFYYSNRNVHSWPHFTGEAAEAWGI